VLDFLKQAVGESTTLFGNGIVAALEAGTQSSALRAFHKTIGDGVKDLIFKGATEAFLASAQFNDLLAPIQQVIRDFTQQAIASGETPDLAEFRKALAPKIEDVTTRAELLEELIREFQKFGLDIKGLVRDGGKRGPIGPITIQLNHKGKNVKQVAIELEDYLRGALSAG
jgi:hypothetical protein